MSDYHFFYVDVDGITIRPPYPLRSESERRILGIDDFCWAYEAACTVTCQPRPAANRKARFDSRELNIFYWREAVNMVKDCLTKQKYCALGDISWLDDLHLVRELNNGGDTGADIDTPDFDNNGVFNTIFEEQNLFLCSTSGLDEDSADFFSRVDSRSRILEGLVTFWENVNKLSLFFENDKICQTSSGRAVFSKGEYQVKTAKYSSGRVEVSEQTPSDGLSYRVTYDNIADPNSETIIEVAIGSSVTSSFVINNNVFASNVEKIILTQYIFSDVQKWSYDILFGMGDMTYRYYVGENLFVFNKSDGIGTQNGTVFNIPPEFCAHEYCSTIMHDRGFDLNDETKGRVYSMLQTRYAVIFKMKFPWTVAD